MRGQRSALLLLTVTCPLLSFPGAVLVCLGVTVSDVVLYLAVCLGVAVSDVVLYLAVCLGVTVGHVVLYLAVCLGVAVISCSCIVCVMGV